MLKQGKRRDSSSQVSRGCWVMWALRVAPHGARGNPANLNNLDGLLSQIAGGSVEVVSDRVSCTGRWFTRPRRYRFTKVRPRSHRLVWSLPERPRLACRAKLAAGGSQVNLGTWKSPSRSLSLLGLISHETQDFSSFLAAMSNN